MAISTKDVEYLAHLARMELSSEELKRFTVELAEILEYVEKLKSAATQGVPPTSHVLALANVFREDEVRPSLSPEEALANAPSAEGAFFKVPRIIDVA